ncbi:MAG: helix-turn-helix domain-containing protein [Parcubacteria group bacterium]
MPKKTFYSTTEVAKILHLSRIEVFRKIKAGKIKAEKIGRNYIIPHESVMEILGSSVGSHKKAEIEKAIDKALKEYGEAFRKLGEE